MAATPEPTRTLHGEPLPLSECHGGLDNRFQLRPILKDDYMRTVALACSSTTPALYPRNPVGKGYLVMPDPVDEVELPNLEDPPTCSLPSD